MAYLVFNSIVVALFYMLEKHNFSRGSTCFFVLFILIFVAFLPAFQDSVTSDYDNYIRLIESHSNQFLEKKEFLTHAILSTINFFDLDPQYFFIFSALIQSAFLINLINGMRNNGYDGYLIFLFLFIVTGMLHNQMNIIRTYFAVYAFLNVVLYRFYRDWFKVLLFTLIGALSHKTFIIVVVPLLVPVSFFIKAGERKFLVYVSSFLFFGLFFVDYFLNYLVYRVLPFYSHYLDSSYNTQQFILGVLSKIYYFPVYILFFYVIRFKRINFSDFDLYILGYWAFFSPIFISFLDSGLMFRAYHYFVFFNLIPLYWVVKIIGAKPLSGIVILYSMAPYVFKTLAFTYGGYGYQSILGPICDFPWSDPQC
jgi:hypothetical protein